MLFVPSFLRPWIWFTCLALGVMPAVAEARTVNFAEVAGQAVGGGSTDHREALAKVLSSLQAGDILLVPPGEYRVVLGKAGLTVPVGVTILGQGRKSVFVLASEGGEKEYREFLRPQSGVVLEGITIERRGAFPLVMMPVVGKVEGLTLRGGRFIGNSAAYPGTYCHALQVGGGDLSQFEMDGVEIRGCTYGLFQSNQAKGKVEGVLVRNSEFAENESSDLEFNAPNGIMRDIVVRDCVFRDNRSKNASGGFAVGFANVQKATVQDCRIENYGAEALHVEDRSAEVLLKGNTVVTASTLQNNGIILVVNASHGVVIEGNYLDARRNGNATHMVLATAGGSKFEKPTDVVVKDNILIMGAATKKWYLEPGVEAAPPSGNKIIPWESP
ncbi:right-handed parallel beta-helix repeat-containing protein [Verrucomicrobium sp. BvORR034]|uniref:right-handed parallel beta-helix repeat-containing protein n=1 Tax=Verrucomicrobium sp. BvORR034 TaxID=1396418 RepID=UPI000678F402|nr:right-handed parallel beta-helix repeat-containing protein [Verrucomicrobium sp. BvORR034]